MGPGLTPCARVLLSLQLHDLGHRANRAQPQALNSKCVGHSSHVGPGDIVRSKEKTALPAFWENSFHGAKEHEWEGLGVVWSAEQAVRGAPEVQGSSRPGLQPSRTSGVLGPGHPALHLMAVTVSLPHAARS